SISFEKPAKALYGFANGTSLRFGSPGSARSPLAARAPESIPQELLLAGGRVSVRLDWQSPYDGSSGTAFGVPRGDRFGYFFYTSPRNPEVFVKVLDFGD